MSDLFSRSQPSRGLGSRLQSLRSLGRRGILVALGAPESEGETASLPPKPPLRGEALAKHHLALALQACQEPGTSKPEAFRILRLLVNQLEQGRVPIVPPIEVSTGSEQTEEAAPSSSRRARLLSRAFVGAQHLSMWRSDALPVQQENLR